MEQRARLDPNRLPRGRTYARKGRVGKLAVAPGEVSAAVWGSRPTPYVVNVRVRVLTDEEWDRVLGAVAGRAAHTAALLDGELPPEVVADAAAAGVELLPGPGEVGPRCSCPDWAEPCKHSAAVVYLVADVLDADPFALLWLRGRSREDVLAELRRRRAGAASPVVGGGRPVDHGVAARDAFATHAGTLPPVPLAPRHPGQPVPLAMDPPQGSGLRAVDLAELASDTARRAWEMCAGDGDGGLGLDPALDLARRAAAWSGSPGASRLAEAARRAGVRPQDLGRRAMAWRRGGADAVAVLDETWAPGSEAMEEGRSAAGGRVRDNRITLAGGAVQLRLGRAGQWYRFELFGHRWGMVAGPAADPVALLSPAAAST
jgi:hypothetical protein